MSARICAFTPTQRPGIDVTHASILRQQTEGKILWLVADELYDERKEVFDEFASRDAAEGKYEYEHFHVPTYNCAMRNVARCYNVAIEKAKSWGADIFLSVQDYIWIPDDGFQRFVNMWRDVELADNNVHLYTGICSISDDPYDDAIVDINNMYSIFAEPYGERPAELDWLDVRYRYDANATFHRCPEIEWETNFACIPYHALYDERLQFDEAFDYGEAFENQDYAYSASKLGYTPLIDMNNQVISLPHKRYFAEEWAKEDPNTSINEQRIQDKWRSKNES